MADAIKTDPVPKAEKTVPVLLRHDVWLEDGTRVRTNIPRLDAEGNIQVERKSRTLLVDQVTVDLPISLAKKLIAEGKADRADPMPE